MTTIRLDIPDEILDSGPIRHLSDTILLSSAIQLYREEKLSSEQGARLAGLSHEEFFTELGEREGGWELCADDKLEGSQYLARVLWALEQVENRSLPAMTAAEIAKFVSANSTVTIQQTNTARFFRDCREDGRFEENWEVSAHNSRRCYQLSPAGKELLHKAKPTPTDS